MTKCRRVRSTNARDLGSSIPLKRDSAEICIFSSSEARERGSLEVLKRGIAYACWHFSALAWEC